MPDLRTITPKSTTFVNNWDGTGRWVFGLEDGSCLYVVTTAGQAALHLEELSKFVAEQVRRSEKK